MGKMQANPERRATLLKSIDEASKAYNSPACAVCQDSKFVHPRKEGGKVDYTRVIPCECIRAEREEARRQNLIKWCELPPKGKEMTFESFRQSSALQKAYAACLDMAEERRKEWLTLMGPTGTGKTHLGIAICNRWLADGKPAKYTSVPLFLDQLRAAFKLDGENSYHSRYHIFLTVPLLMLDDLGTENVTDWTEEHLYGLLDYRLMHQLPTVLTTNVPLDKINFRIRPRLTRDGGEIIHIDAEAYRKKVVRR
jgi:DNA replication protein DnaC